MPLTRVDHVGTQHLIFDHDEYRDVNVLEGLASEIDLRCTHCHSPLTMSARQFFYKRWVAVKEATAVMQTRGEG
jgi:hypothetical protein